MLPLLARTDVAPSTTSVDLDPTIAKSTMTPGDALKSHTDVCVVVSTIAMPLQNAENMPLTPTQRAP